MTIQEIKQAVIDLKAAHSLAGLSGVTFQQNSVYEFIKPMLVSFDSIIEAHEKGLISEEKAIAHLVEGLQMVQEAFNTASTK